MDQIVITNIYIYIYIYIFNDIVRVWFPHLKTIPPFGLLPQAGSFRSAHLPHNQMTPLPKSSEIWMNCLANSIDSFNKLLEIDLKNQLNLQDSLSRLLIIYQSLCRSEKPFFLKVQHSRLKRVVMGILRFQ